MRSTNDKLPFFEEMGVPEPLPGAYDDIEPYDPPWKNPPEKEK